MTVILLSVFDDILILLTSPKIPWKKAFTGHTSGADNQTDRTSKPFGSIWKLNDCFLIKTYVAKIFSGGFKGG